MSDRAPNTAQREQQIAEASRGAGQLIPPPYHVHDMDILYLLCRFDLEIARKILPPPLEPTDDGFGVIMLPRARRGWVIAPFSGVVATLQVKGFDGPDKYPANYVHTAHYSGTCGQNFSMFYNDRLSDGSCRLDVDPRSIRGVGGRNGADTIRVSARRTSRVTDEIVGMNGYLSSLGDTVQVYSTSYTARFEDLEDVSVEIFDTAPEPLRSLKPLEIVWPLWLEGMTMTFNPARTLGTEVSTVSSETALAAVLDLIKRFKRPSAVLTSTGRPLFVSREAADLMAEGQLALGSTKLLAPAPEGDRRRLADPILIDHPSGRPLLAQVVPIMLGIASEPLRLVLFVDPKGGQKGDPEAILELMGLTPAEARLAARVGAGVSPQDAAAELGVTTHTARSTLKAIFDKLGVERQSQLAQLVTRLETI